MKFSWSMKVLNQQSIISQYQSEKTSTIKPTKFLTQKSCKFHIYEDGPQNYQILVGPRTKHKTEQKSANKYNILFSDAKIEFQTSWQIHYFLQFFKWTHIPKPLTYCLKEKRIKKKTLNHNKQATITKHNLLWFKKQKKFNHNSSSLLH